MSHKVGNPEDRFSRVAAQMRRSSDIYTLKDTFFHYLLPLSPIIAIFRDVNIHTSTVQSLDPVTM